MLLVYLAYACYWWFQERFLFVRFTFRRISKFSNKQDHEELWMDRPDGARLHALHFPVKGATGAVLYLHGNTGSLRRWQSKASSASPALVSPC